VTANASAEPAICRAKRGAAHPALCPDIRRGYARVIWDT
jgi:hypothetical protein